MYYHYNTLQFKNINITLEDMYVNLIKNLKELQEIKYINNVKYVISYTSIITIILVSVVFILYCKTKKRATFDINNKIIDTQESISLKEGGVTFPKDSITL